MCCDGTADNVEPGKQRSSIWSAVFAKTKKDEMRHNDFKCHVLITLKIISTLVYMSCDIRKVFSE